LASILSQYSAGIFFLPFAEGYSMKVVRGTKLGVNDLGVAVIYGQVQEDVELRQRIAREVGLGFQLPSFAPVERPELELAEAIARHWIRA
jgi:hypothetical protein